MPLQYTAAQSSRIKKPSATRTSARSSLFAHARRTKPLSLHGHHGSKRNDHVSGHHETNLIYEQSLPDLGPSHYLAESTVVNNVIQAVQYIQNTMFTAMPESRTGMNSTRIAQVLNFRRSLPPVVSVAHVHVLLNDPTRVEKEIVELVDSGRLRRLVIPGRGGGIHGLGDCLVLVEDWETLVRSSSSLEDGLKGLSLPFPCCCLLMLTPGAWIDKFIGALSNNIKSSAVSTDFFTPTETSCLVRAGFLVSASSLSKDLSINPGLSDKNTNPKQRFRDSAMILTLPNMGPYLRLLGAARSQMLSTLKKSSHGEMPMDLLQDRWDGSVETNTLFSAAKRARGESTGVLPGRTKKWKELYGVNFRWALEEALGAGFIEVFDTGSVGPGVRSL